MYDVSINTLGERHDHFCNGDMDSNYDEEIYKMIANKNSESLNCSVPFHPPIRSDMTGKLIGICNNSNLGMKAYENYDEALRIGPQIPKYKPCSSMDVVLGLPLIALDQDGNEAFIRFYFKSHVKVKSIILYYDFASLVADLGGYIGMLLGISLIDLTLKFNSILVKVIKTKLKHNYEGPK